MVKDVDVLPLLYQRLVDPDFMLSDQISTILSNLAREEKTCKSVFKVKRVTQVEGEWWIVDCVSGRVEAAWI